jgi:hypothetical protein
MVDVEQMIPSPEVQEYQFQIREKEQSGKKNAPLKEMTCAWELGASGMESVGHQGLDYDAVDTRWRKWTGMQPIKSSGKHLLLPRKTSPGGKTAVASVPPSDRSAGFLSFLLKFCVTGKSSDFLRHRSGVKQPRQRSDAPQLVKLPFASAPSAEETACRDANAFQDW